MADDAIEDAYINDAYTKYCCQKWNKEIGFEAFKPAPPDVWISCSDNDPQRMMDYAKSLRGIGLIADYKVRFEDGRIDVYTEHRYDFGSPCAEDYRDRIMVLAPNVSTRVKQEILVRLIAGDEVDKDTARQIAAECETAYGDTPALLLSADELQLRVDYEKTKQSMTKTCKI